MPQDFFKNIDIFFSPILMPGDYRFDHVRTLKKIDLYYNSQYESGLYDSSGFKKLFYNIIKPAIDIAVKFIDLDTKDILLIPSKPETEKRVWLMQRDLKHWFKEQRFGSLLNEIAQDYPKYGSVVIKKSNKGLKKVNLHNLRMDPTATSLTESQFVYELIRISRGDIEEMDWDLSKLDESKKEFFIYETYEKEGKDWIRRFYADPISYRETLESAESKLNFIYDVYPNVLLKEEEIKEDQFPYRELHWEKLPGRWLGQGFAEYLFENQVAENEAENLERKALYYKALQLWQTRDERVGRNVFTDLENGDILRVNSEITPIQKDNSDLAAFNVTRNRWSLNTERKTFSFDIARGEELPSRTPLGVAQLSAGMVASYFDLKRENFGLFLKELLIKDVIPEFKDKSRGEHILTILGSDKEIDKIDSAIAEVAVTKAALEFADQNGRLPSVDEREREKGRILREIKEQTNRYFKILKDFYEDVEHFVEIEITGEAIDTRVRNQTIMVAMQILGSNPAIMQNKALRTMFFWMLEQAGVSPLDLNLFEEELQRVPALPQGGSVALPVQPPAPVAGPEMVTA